MEVDLLKKCRMSVEINIAFSFMLPCEPFVDLSGCNIFFSTQVLSPVDSPQLLSPGKSEVPCLKIEDSYHQKNSRLIVVERLML